MLLLVCFGVQALGRVRYGREREDIATFYSHCGGQVGNNNHK